MKRLRTITAGELVKQVVYTVPRLSDTKKQRAEKSQATKAAQAKMNYKNSAEHLEFMIAANFKNDDYFVTLTFNDENLPKDHTAMRDSLRSFFRSIRGEYRRTGEPLKYIYTLEGRDSEETRLHTHVIINSRGSYAADKELFCSMWPFGFVNVKSVKTFVSSVSLPDENMYSALAGYMCKDQYTPNGAQRYTGSRNLLKPVSACEELPDSVTLSEPPTGALVIDRDNHETLYGSYRYVKYIYPPLLIMSSGESVPATAPRSQGRKRKEPSRI